MNVMLWTMLIIISNPWGGQPSVIPGYTFKTQKECEAARFEDIQRMTGDEVTAHISAACVPMDPAYMGTMFE